MKKPKPKPSKNEWAKPRADFYTQPLNNRQKADVAALANAPMAGWTVTEFAADRGIGGSAASARLYQLVKLGAVRRVSRGKYAT